MNMNEQEKTKGTVLKITRPNTITSGIFHFCKLLILKAVSVGTIYSTGYININPLLLLGIIMLFMFRDQQRLENRFQQEVAMAISLRNDRLMVLANIDQPPSWVYFPDIERCEWLNKMISHLWPSLSLYIVNILRSAVEPSINEVLSGYVKNPNFKFQQLTLGSNVPRICGLKVYNKHTRQREEIILDMNIFYGGDSDFSFSLKSVGGGIQKFEIGGWMRVVLKLLVTPMPLLGAIDVFFLRKPKVNFNLTGGLNILELPGLNWMLHKTIDDQISAQLVLPNKFTVKLNDIVESGQWKFPDPEGLLRINVAEAKNLLGSGSGFFGTDPYLIITFGSKTIISPFAESSHNPEWNFWAEFIIDSTFDVTVLITIKEREGKNTLGKVSLELDMVKNKHEIDAWVQLEDVKTGMIHLCAYYYNVSYNPNDLYTSNLPCLLVVFINSVNNVVNPRSKQKPNYVVHLEVSEITQLSKPVTSENPTFEEVFSFAINDPKINKLRVKIIDQNTKTDLGKATVGLVQLVEATDMEIIDQVYPLENTTAKSSVLMSMRLRALKND